MRKTIKRIFDDQELADTAIVLLGYIFMLVALYAIGTVNQSKEPTKKQNAGFDFNGDTLFEVEPDGTVTKYYEYNE